MKANTYLPEPIRQDLINVHEKRISELALEYDMSELLEGSMIAERQYLDAINDRYSSRYGIQGKDRAGSFHIKGTREIVIGGRSKQNPRTLAHELGHNRYPPDALYVQPGDVSSAEEYVEKNLDRHLKGKGHAKFNEYVIGNDITRDPGIAYPSDKSGQGDYFQKVYNNWELGNISKDEAVTKMGDKFKELNTSLTDADGNHITYRDHYGQRYKELIQQRNLQW